MREQKDIRGKIVKIWIQQSSLRTKWDHKYKHFKKTHTDHPKDNIFNFINIYLKNATF